MTERWADASLWAAALPEATKNRAPAPGRAEIAVVGAGLVGLTIAATLHRAGHAVVVLDRYGIGGITSRGSTGKLTALQGSLLSSIHDRRGPDAAQSYALAARTGVDGLQQLIRDLEIDAAMERVDDHVVALEPDELRACHDELEAARAAGLPVDWVDGSALAVPALGGVRLRDQAQLDPAALVAGLAASMPTGAVVTGWPVVEIRERSSDVEVLGEDGRRFVADHVIQATMGPIHDPAQLAARCQASRSHVIAAHHPDPPAGTYISLGPHARSIRRTRGPHGPLVLVAGESHPPGDDQGRSTAERANRLARFAMERLGATGVSHQWTAHDLLPSDAVPFIGQLAPRTRRLWVAAGFQKWGISTAWVAADLLTAQIEGGSRPWASLFDPTRLRASVNRPLAEGALRAARHAIVEPVTHRLRRSEASPRCTHLGCSLHFDAGEGTWDCPCHGSRFNADGVVVAGPAARPLETKARGVVGFRG